MYISITEAFFMAQFIVAIVQNTFVTVEEIARFLNIVLGTKTITTDKINNMLVQAEYQLFTDYIELDDERIIEGYIAPTEFVPTKKSIGWYKVEKFRGELRLLWKASLLLNISNTSISNTEYLTGLILAYVYNYRLIDSRIENINTKVLQQNVELLKNIIKGRNNIDG